MSVSIPVTLFYASFFALFGLVLSFRAGSMRGRSGISILYGNPPNMELAERVRAHQNFLEYVPLVLIMFGLLEANGVSRMYLYVTATCLSSRA